MSGTADSRGEVFALAERIGDLHLRAHSEYEPLVAQILQTGSRDTFHIERTLDGLLDFCGNSEVLQLYRRLCRYYFTFEPIAAGGYVNAYREMFDSDDGAEVG